MNNLKYVKFSEVNQNDFIELLNSQKTRKHLVQHDYFDTSSINEWIKSKIDMDSTSGCRVRGIIARHSLAGWCGIQLENGQYEIAIVLGENFWGIGVSVFKELMTWAKELGHKEIYIHFLETRPEYKFLRKRATQILETEHFGRKFTTYRLPVR